MSSSGSRPGLLPGVDPAMYDARRRNRSPASHAALERMLAERRAARRRGAAPTAGVRTAPGLTSSRTPVWQDVSPRQVPSPSPPPPQQQQQHWRRHQPGGLRVRPRASPPLDGSVAQRRAALLAPFGFAGRRRASRPKSKGAGWHRRGWREYGEMWINVKMGSRCVKGQDVDESISLAAFVRQIQDSQEGGDYQPYRNQTWDLRFRKQSLRQLLEDIEAQGLEDQDVIVRDLFDGGETVYYRVYDEDGNMMP